MKLFAIVAISIFFTACSHKPASFKRSVSSDEAATESSEATSPEAAPPQWVAHPCGQTPKAPFRKYKTFLFDSQSKKLLGKTSEKSSPVEIKTDGAATLEEFFTNNDITQFCQNAAGVKETSKPPSQTTEPKPSEQRPSKQQLNVAFVAPITKDVRLYTAPLNEKTEGDTKTLRQRLTDLLSMAHLQTPDQPDRLVSACPKTLEKNQICVQQKRVNYEEARKMMMGAVDLREVEKKYEIFDYYCQAWLTEEDFQKITENHEEWPGPNHIVHSKLVNTEHTWPQSKFTAPTKSKKAEHVQENLIEKTDLHHIYPTDTEVNRIRGNFPFAEVDPNGAEAMKCSDGKLGSALPIDGHTGGEQSFEPPRAHKGNVARSLFYFSVRYKATMPALQEAYARKWNREDPPDEQEKARNEKIYKLIGVRNPFVDDPSLIDQL